MIVAFQPHLYERSPRQYSGNYQRKLIASHRPFVMRHKGLSMLHNSFSNSEDNSSKIQKNKKEDLIFSDDDNEEDLVNEMEFDMLEFYKQRALDRNDVSAVKVLEKKIADYSAHDEEIIHRLNNEFYKAFTTQNYRLMTKLWLKDDAISCIQPGHPDILVGYEKVMKIWMGVLAPKSSWVKVTPEECSVVVKGNTAIATCYERISQDPTGIRGTLANGGPLIMNSGNSIKSEKNIKGGQEQRLFATKIFVKQDGQWYVVHHHATYLKKQERKKSGSGGLNGLQVGISPNALQQIQGLQGIQGARIINLGSLGKQLGNSGSGGIMGLPGQGQTGQDGQNNAFTNNLSSSSNDKLDSIAETLSAMSAGSSSKSYRDIDSDEDDDDEEEDDDLNEENDSIFSDDANLDKGRKRRSDSGKVSAKVKVLKDGRYLILRPGSNGNFDEEDPDFNGEYGFLSDGPDEYAYDEDSDNDYSTARDKSLTRRTVRAIQHLCQEGRISVEQKRRLLNEIIQHANDEVPSMVEIAYELLLRSEEEDDDDDIFNQEDDDLSVGATKSSFIDSIEDDDNIIEDIDDEIRTKDEALSIVSVDDRSDSDGEDNEDLSEHDTRMKKDMEKRISAAKAADEREEEDVYISEKDGLLQESENANNKEKISTEEGLLGEKEISDDILEEFADQCRIIADQLLPSI